MQDTAEGEVEVAFFIGKRLDKKCSYALFEFATPCHDTQVVGSYRQHQRLEYALARLSTWGDGKVFLLAHEKLIQVDSILLRRKSSKIKRRAFSYPLLKTKSR